MWLIKEMKLYNNIIKESFIIGLLIILMVTFISLGIIVAEKSVNDLLGSYNSPGTIYFTEIIEPEIIRDKNESIDKSNNIEFIKADNTQLQQTSINKLALVLDENIANKSRIVIMWVIDKIACGIDHLADILVKILQST
jgi:hypothetical protein